MKLQDRNNRGTHGRIYRVLHFSGWKLINDREVMVTTEDPQRHVGSRYSPRASCMK
jgi:hypothetical protein